MRQAPKNIKAIKHTMVNGELFEGVCGNKKVPTSTLIFNMGSATECPSDKLGLCSLGGINGDGTCYALKAERIYKTPLYARERQAKIWLETPTYILIDTLKEIVRKNPFLTAIRVNESGDFYTKKCVDKLNQIAKAMDIPVYAYTHRLDLFTESVVKNLNPNLTMNFSQEMSFNHDHNEFILSDEIDESRNSVPCIGDCKLCSLCVTKTGGMAVAIDRH